MTIKPKYDLCGKPVTRDEFIENRLKAFWKLHYDAIKIRAFKPKTPKEKELWEIAWRADDQMEDAISLVQDLQMEIKILEEKGTGPKHDGHFHSFREGSNYCMSCGVPRGEVS